MDKIDNLDKKILSILSQNARIPFKDVAAECNVSRAAIHQRVQHLIERHIPEVVECHFTTGPYTMMVKLYARDNEQLMHLLNGRLQDIPGVVATETLISLEQSIKRDIPVHFEE